MAQPICIQAQNVRTCASLADLHAHYMFILVSFYLDGYATGPFCHIHDGSLLEKALEPRQLRSPARLTGEHGCKLNVAHAELVVLSRHSSS